MIIELACPACSGYSNGIWNICLNCNNTGLAEAYLDIWKSIKKDQFILCKHS